MFDPVFTEEPDDGWEYHGFDVDNPDSQHVASHECGATVTVDPRPREAPNGILVMISHTVECDGVVAEPVTNSEFFEHDSAAVGYLRDRSSRISSTDEQLNAFAVVPHDGTLEGVAIETLADPDPDMIASAKMADVFCVFNDELPADVTVEDIRNSRLDLVNAVYGDPIDDLPDSLETLTSESAAYGQTSIDCYTVTNEELRIASEQSADATH